MSKMTFDNSVEWLRANRQFLSITGIEKELSIPSAGLRHFLDGRRGMPEKYEKDIIRFVEKIRGATNMKKKLTPEERFWQIIKSINRPFLTQEDCPDEVFFFRDNDYIMSYDKKTKILWCSWEHLWLIFEKEYNKNYEGIQEMIKIQVEQSFKVEGVTPEASSIPTRYWVEQAFKVEGVTLPR